MNGSIVGVVWRLAIFITVCVFGIVAIFAVFSDLRFQPETSYFAKFTDVSGLRDNQFVRIAGVEVGKVKSIAVQRDTTVLVEFTADDSVMLTEGNRAVIRYDDLIGGRYLAIEEGAGGSDRLPAGATIPVSNTDPALDLDELIGGFRPLFRALDPEQVNALTGQLIRAFEGQGATLSSFLQQTAALTNTLSDRDQLIGQVVVNLDTVLGSLGDQSNQFAKAVDSLSQLVGTLSSRRTDVSNSIAYANGAANSVADLLAQSREPLQKVVTEVDRTASTVLSDKDYFDNLLATLPDAYKIINRQGIYGDYFSFYFCDILLKLNGKGGDPVYVKLAGQSTGRCAPR